MDARSLLRAKKAEAKIEHPYASYSASGVLRCSICAVPVKQWDAHLLTKQHRTSVSREKAIQAKTAAKRAAPESPEPASSKRSRITQEDRDEEQESTNTVAGLPAGFFDAGKTSTVNDEEDENENEDVLETTTKAAPEPTGDAELDDFLASLESDDAPVLPSVISATTQTQSNRKGYQLSSSIAAPGIASYEAAPVRLPQPGDAPNPDEEPESEETEEAKRERIAREEREEIMGRLEEEERAQEDADSRVSALKARMEALKKKRESRPAKSKPKASTNGA